MRKRCFNITLFCLLMKLAFGQSDTLQHSDYLVPPGYADAYISMPEGDPIGMPDPKLTIILVEGDDLEVDSVHLRIFNGEHQLLGEYCSFEHKTVVDPRMVIIYDTAAVNYYGMYYIEASKPGYKTREIAYELGTGEIRPLAGIVMERKDGSGWMLAGAVAVAVAGGAWWFIRRRKRLTVNE